MMTEAMASDFIRFVESGANTFLHPWLVGVISEFGVSLR